MIRPHIRWIRNAAMYGVLRGAVLAVDARLFMHPEDKLDALRMAPDNDYLWTIYRGFAGVKDVGGIL